MRLRTGDKGLRAYFESRIVHFLAGEESKTIATTILPGKSLRHLCQLVGKGVDHQLESIGDAQLRIDGTEVMRDGGVADEESIGYLLVLESLRDQSDDFALALRQ